MTTITLCPLHETTVPRIRYEVRDADAALLGHIESSRPHAWEYHDAKDATATVTASSFHELRFKIRRLFAEG
jgi:hypothetical protein